MWLRKNRLLPYAYIVTLITLGIELGGFQFVLLRIGEEFALSNTLMGSLVSVHGLAMIAGSLLCGRLADRHNKRSVTLLGVLVFCIGGVLICLCRGIALYLTGLFCLGMGYGTVQVPLATGASETFPSSGSRIISIAQASFSLGAVLSPLLMKWLVTGLGYNWRTLYLITSLLSSVCLIMIFFAYFAPAESATVHTKSKQASPLRLLLHPLLLCCVAAMLCCAGMEKGSTFFINSLFTNDFSAAEQGALSISLIWAAMIPSRLLGGILKKPDRPVLIGFLLSAACCAALAFIKNPNAALALCFAFGFFYGPVWPAIMGTAAQNFGAHSAFATSVVIAGSGVGGVLVPILTGWIADKVTLSTAFLMIGSIGAAGCLFYLLSLQKKRMIPSASEKTLDKAL